MMYGQRRSSRVVAEELDEAQLEFDRHRLEAKNIFDRAKSSESEMTGIQQQTFNRATDAAKEWRKKIGVLETELQTAQNSEQQIKGQAMSRHPSANIYNSNFSGDQRPERVLPTNGILPNDQQQRYQPYQRIGKLRAFKSDQEAFDVGQWYKAVVARAIHGTIDSRAESHCASRGLEITNAGTEGSGVAGGYLVPAPLSAAIIEIRESVGVARQVCQIQPMSSDTLTMPKPSGGLTVYYPNEGQALTDSDKGWGSVSVNARKRACLSYLSQELVDDALISIVDNVVSEMAYALALREDTELINGSGASTYGGVTGLLSSIGSAGVYTTPANMNTWSEITIADMANTVAKLPDRYHVYGPSWICSHAFYNAVMMRLAFAAGGATASEVLGGTATRKSFMGYPVYLTSQMPIATADSAVCALFGSYSQGVLLGDRGGIRIARSDDFRFTEDLVSLKATSRYDMTVHNHGDASSAGAYVGLSTNAA